MTATPFATNTYQRAIQLILFAISLAILHGCVSLAPAADADSLRQRAEAYWKARLIGDRITAFDYEENKARGTQTLQAYARKSPPIFLRATITDVRITRENKGIVSLDTAYTVPGLPMRTPLLWKMKDEWTLIDGHWYHVDQPASPIREKLRN
jgi:hypothetical protein